MTTTAELTATAITFPLTDAQAAAAAMLAHASTNPGTMPVLCNALIRRDAAGVTLFSTNRYTAAAYRIPAPRSDHDASWFDGSGRYVTPDQVAAAEATDILVPADALTWLMKVKRTQLEYGDLADCCVRVSDDGVTLIVEVRNAYTGVDLLTKSFPSPQQETSKNYPPVQKLFPDFVLDSDTAAKVGEHPEAGLPEMAMLQPEYLIPAFAWAKKWAKGQGIVFTSAANDDRYKASKLRPLILAVGRLRVLVTPMVKK